MHRVLMVQNTVENCYPMVFNGLWGAVFSFSKKLMSLNKPKRAEEIV